MTRTSVVHAIATALVLASLAPPGAKAEEATKAQVPHTQVVSSSPFGLMIEWFNAEYERKATRNTTWGLSGSFFSMDGGDVDYASGTFLFRYYPQGAALNGFYLGGRTGVYHLGDYRDSEVAYGLGFEVGYNWLFGANRRFALGIGAGMTRLIGGDLDGSFSIPTFRVFNVGVAF